MAIVFSVIKSEGVVQVDGSKQITESHIDSSGIEHLVIYILLPGMDKNSVLAQHAVGLSDMLKSNELQEISQNFMIGVNLLRDSAGNEISPKYSTRTEAIVYALKELLSVRDGWSVARGAGLLDMLTDAQMRALLGITQVHLSNIRVKATVLKSAASALSSYSPEVLNG